ncbi:MAG: radical SAM protein [Thermoanaerobaculia bacterium]
MEQKQPVYRSNPSVIVWEPTRACDLTCIHCRAAAQPRRSAFELTTEEGFRLIDQIADLRPGLFVLSGGDPLKRPDIYNFVEYAEARGLITSLNVSPTALLNADAIAELKARGLARLAISLDGSTAEIHDAIRGIEGSFDVTIRALRTATLLGIPVEVNTSLIRETLSEIDALTTLIDALGAVTWNVFFPVPAGPDDADGMMSAEEAEAAFEKLYENWLRVDFQVEPVEAPHYRRYILQREAERVHRSTPAIARRAKARGVETVLFISHLGDVCASGFLPLAAGNIRRTPLETIYRESPLFAHVRNTDTLQGRCGACEYRDICGGSRARAYALTGDVMAEDPLCIWVPEEGESIADARA